MRRKNIPNQISIIYTKNYCDLQEIQELKHILSQMIIHNLKFKKTKNDK